MHFRNHVYGNIYLHFYEWSAYMKFGALFKKHSVLEGNTTFDWKDLRDTPANFKR